MPVSSFPVRIFDVDVFGELRVNVLLRFLWQSASDASAAVGYDLDWYERAGTLWIIRRTRLEVLAPVRHRDALVVCTWVSDIRRVRSQRQYEVRRGEALVARATTDWVYVDLARGALVQPPADLQRALMPDGVRSEPRPQSLATDPPPGAWRGTRRVALADLDTVAHVNNAQYAVVVQQAVWDALAAHGWTIALPGSGHLQLGALDLEYFEGARYGDTWTIAVWTRDGDETTLVTDCELRLPSGRSLHARAHWRWSDGALPADLLAAADALRG